MSLTGPCEVVRAVTMPRSIEVHRGILRDLTGGNKRALEDARARNAQDAYIRAQTPIVLVSARSARAGVVQPPSPCRPLRAIAKHVRACLQMERFR